MFCGIGVGARQQNTELGMLRTTGPNFGTIHHPFVAIALGAGRQTREVATTAWLTKELAPYFLRGEQRKEVTLFLFFASGIGNGGPCPANTNGIRRTLHSCSRELVVDDELMNGVCGQAPRRWPVGGNIASMRKLARCGPRMLS